MKVLIVPEDSAVLIDGKHWRHHDIKALEICARTEHLKPSICVKAAHYDSDKQMALIEWSMPEHSWITKEQFLELFGHAIEDHGMFVLQNEAEAENWRINDEEQTRRIAENENKLFDQKKMAAG